MRLPDPVHGTEHRGEPSAKDDLGFDLPKPAAVSKGRIVLICLVLCVLVGAALAFGYLPRHRQRAALESEAASSSDALPKVEVVRPTVVTSDRALRLPASVQALEETTIYPRANGYVRKWLVDIGDKVKEGDVLAEIDTPEVDQEMAQARAQLEKARAGVVQAKASRDFSISNLERYKQLTPAGITSQQELEQKRSQSQVDEADVTVAQAAVSAEEANIRRLNQVKSFARVTAPFAGKIVQRWIERGALVNSGTATPLYRIAAMDPVRVLVQIPQDVAPSVRTEASANVTVREFPGRVFEGKVARAAGALDPASRTMTTEVRVPNPKGELLAGMYAELSLTLPSPHKVLEVAATAVSTDAKGVRVAVVSENGTVHLAPVVIERDTGPTVQIASGITEKDRIVKIARADLHEGLKVQVAP